MRQYKLHNRYGEPVLFKEVEKDVFELVDKLDKDGESYIQCNYMTDAAGNEIYTSVDPSGGPCIGLGENVIPVLRNGHYKEYFFDVRYIYYEGPKIYLRIANIQLFKKHKKPKSTKNKI